MRTVSTIVGGKRLGLAMAAICLWGSLGTARADLQLWYTGDADDFNATYNTINRETGFGIVYDTFVVPAGETWTITGAFSNDFMNYYKPSFLTANWIIRSDVSDGNGGTLVASGTEAASQTATGGNFNGYNEYTVAVSGLNVTLGPGTYSVAVVPVATRGDQYSYIATTSGGPSAIGDQSTATDTYVAGRYYTNPNNFPGSYNYWPGVNVVQNTNGGAPIFSMGVDGISVASVPEPSTLVTSAIGALTMLVYGWRSRRPTPDETDADDQGSVFESRPRT